MIKFNFYELLGVMIGDGCILWYPYNRVYGIEINGNADEENSYYQIISSYLEKKFGKKPRVYVKTTSKGRCLRLTLWGKYIAEYFITKGITPRKTYSARIPLPYLPWRYSKHILRGIFETDGSLYFSRSKITTSHLTYPRLEIKTVSKLLADQIYILLKQQNFKVQRRTTDTIYRVYLSGVDMLELWVKTIGFTNEKTLSKYYFWKKYGYYTPHLSFHQRATLLEKNF